ncbi:hypothetical protein RRG08_049689 [Elysia crispata]|uniref:Uncharacterized protein n=1 Tax=Elysia crispata TaxID=231223 RepID=A0AAE0ZXE3_9GAST|nr:hypothetical protein RRG08_049689 [Elysia crispata]
MSEHMAVGKCQLCRSLSIYRSRTTISSAKNHQPFWQRLLFVSGVGAVIYYIFKDALHEKEIESDPYQPNIQPLFISVDPERDSPKTVKEYCAGKKNIITQHRIKPENCKKLTISSALIVIAFLIPLKFYRPEIFWQ